MLQRKAPVILINTRRHGPFAHLQEIGKVLLVPDLLPKIQLSRMAASQDRHNVADPVVVQMKRSDTFMIYEVHRHSPRQHCVHLSYMRSSFSGGFSGRAGADSKKPLSQMDTPAIAYRHNFL